MVKLVKENLTAVADGKIGAMTVTPQILVSL